MLYAPVQVTAPAAVPVTLADANDFLRRDDDSLDGPLQLMVDGSLAELEATTGLRLIDQTAKVRADCFADLVALNIGPVVSIVDIRYLDQAGVEQVLDPAIFYLAGAGLERGIDRVPGMVWPRTQRRRGAIAATLAVGYGPDAATVPQQLRWALFALIRGKFDDKPADVDALICNHRIYA